MKFTYFDSVSASRGVPCTYDLFNEVSQSPQIEKLANKILREEDKDKRSQMKKRLPIITWQAYFHGRRINSEAEPSGLFILDIDHVENPAKLYNDKVVSLIKSHGIVFVSKTSSGHGLRLVAKCRPKFKNIAECQQWLAKEIGVEDDPHVKDMARSSFVVPYSFIYYMNAKAIWEEEPEEGTVYKLEDATDYTPAEKEHKKEEPQPETDQREGLFGGMTEYKGIPLEKIAHEWLLKTGGEPEEGERNVRLYKLACRMRYITDFNEATLLKNLPRYGLAEDEMKQLIHSACSSVRASSTPNDLKQVVVELQRRANLGEDDEMGDEELEIITNTKRTPSLPPLLRQWHDAAPDDFKAAVVLAQLPILGALGSRLRGKYLDGKLHSPSFQVSLEAPQASGKSFLGQLVSTELALMMEHDEIERKKEREYNEKAGETKMLNIKITVDNKDEILGNKPKGIIRYVPATISITKMLQRMDNAQGLHLFAFAPEIDTVLKAFKRGFSSLSDALRMAFDNDLYGQDYASENSFSGNVKLYYNCLYSGTPKAMRRFYPDVEDGLVSRVLFITLPDQFGKPLPVWRPFDKKEQQIVDVQLERLNEVTLQGDEVMPEHVMKLDWLNKTLDGWLKSQQIFAVKENDRTRDIFCRRAAVVGFRAGMLAYYLWGEKNTPAIRKNTCDFAVWVANNMLNQHLLRFNIDRAGSNTIVFQDAFDMLPSAFDTNNIRACLTSCGFSTNPRMAAYKWRLAGLIEKTGSEGKVSFYKKIENTPSK